MLTTIEILDRLAVKLGKVSDYAVSQELGVERASVSRWRCGHGTMGEETAIKAAEILGEDPRFVLACVLAERTTSTKAKQVFKKMADGFKAASILIAALLAAFLCNTFNNTAEAKTSINSSSYKMYIMLNYRWARYGGTEFTRC